MNRPTISVVVESVTREDYAARPLADDLRPALDGVARQTYPRELIETIVVIDERLAGDESDEIVRRYPWVTIVKSPQRNYFAAKNAGARAARGSLVAMLDGDCEPAADDWLEIVAERFADADVSVVAGRTRYTGNSLGANTFAVFDFATITGDSTGAASGFVANNVAFRREVLLAHPFDARIRRNGGCYLLYHQLRSAGIRIVYEPRIRMRHGLNYAASGAAKRQFERGFDGVCVYELDEGAVLGGTRFYRRFGALALIPITGRRIVLDWLHMIRHHRQMGTSLIAIPYYGAVSLILRLIELSGALSAATSRRTAVPTPESAG